MIKVLFVCLGNICRSPMAEYMFKSMVKKEGLENDFYIDSAGTSSEESGNSMHYGTKNKLDQMNIEYGNHIARKMAKQDYEKFYDGEIQLRKSLNYPPFCDIILLRIHSQNEEKVKKISEKIYIELKKQNNDNLLIYKPVPSPIDKIQNTYRWRIVIKGKLNKKAVNTINNVIKLFYNSKMKEVSLIVDTNPNNMM